MIIRGYPTDAAGSLTAGDVTCLIQHSGDFRFYRTNGSINELYFQVNATAPYWRGNTIWHSANDGAGSGLDADLWDGYQFSSYLNQAVLTSSSPTFQEIYANGWFRNNEANEGLYNQSTTMHLSSGTNGYWDVSSTNTISSIRFYTGGHLSSIRGYVYANSSNEIGFLNSGGNWGLRMDNSYNVQVYGALTVGSGTSSDIYMTDTDENTRRIHTNSGRIGFLNTSNSWGSYCDNSGNWFSDHSVRAPIFYDTNDTAYYGDFASESRLNTLRTAGRVVIGGTFELNAYKAVSSARLHFGGGDSDANGNYYIGTNLENYGGNYTKLDLRWHTGIRMGAQPGYGGIRFFNNEDLDSLLFSIGAGDGNVRSHTNLLPSANNSYNLGSSSLGWANVYTNDLHLSNMNKPEGNDIDGTNGNWTIQEGSENLYIINNNNGKKFKIILEEIK